MNINFSSTIDAAASGTNSLTIKAGDTAGGSPTLTLTGTIGGTTALDALSINAGTSTMAFSLPQIGSGTAAGAGTASADVTIGNPAVEI